MSRNYIKEIEDFQSRLSSDVPRTKLARQRTTELFNSYNFINEAITHYKHDIDFPDNEREEVLKYYPVAIVAAIQGYFKFAIKDLIESGEPYRSKASNFDKELNRLDVKEILAIEDKKLSTADFVAHLVNLNSMDKIESAVNKLSNNETGFFTVLKSSTVRFSYDSEDVKEFEEVADEIFDDLYEIFRLRHIIAHEVTTDIDDFKSKLRRWIIHADLFLYASENEIFKRDKLA